jgi:hypothetical protein
MHVNVALIQEPWLYSGQNLWRRPLRMWVSVANITDELILGLDLLRAYDGSVDIGRQKLRRFRH